MRKITILCILILFLNISIVNAVPSDPNSVSILTQPDGTTFKARMVGDERQSHWELLDGRPIEMDLNDYWVYKGTKYKVMINIYPSTSPAPNENTTTAIQPNINVPKILPDDYLYPIKLFFEDFNEAFTFNDAKKLTLKQEHIQNRFAELAYEMKYNFNKNSEMLLQKIQIKQLELEENMGKLQGNCGDSYAPEIAVPGSCRYFISSEAEVLYKEIKNNIKHNQEVLTRLLNSPDMPEQSRKGLQNAMNNTIKTKVTANMVQGTYTVGSYSSMLPFESVMVYDPNDTKWYSIVVRGDKISITTAPVDNPDYYIYPTSSQMSTLEEIGRDINNNGLTTKNKIKMLKLWYQIKKIEVK